MLSNKKIIMRYNIVLLFFSITIIIFFLFLLEGATRLLFPSINHQDTELRLLKENAFKDSFGWKPNSSGISFGKTVYIDEYGFRKMKSPDTYRDSWVILGDSITFGELVLI